MSAPQPLPMQTWRVVRADTHTGYWGLTPWTDGTPGQSPASEWEQKQDSQRRSNVTGNDHSAQDTSSAAPVHAHDTGVLRVYKFRMYPTAKQESDLLTLLGRLRYFYNAALQERRDGYKAGVKVTRWTQCAAITVIRNDPECAEYKGVTNHLMQDALKRLDRAFDGFFRRVKAGQAPGYPRFKGRDRFNTFAYQDAKNGSGVKIVSGGARLRLQNIGNVKMKQHRPMEGVLKTIGVTRDKCGHWYALITREVAAKPLPATGASVGIDVGLTTFAALSDGAMVANPRPMKAARIRVERAQRKVSRRKRGSKRRGKARVLLAKAHVHVANVRRDFHHKTARTIVQKYDRIAIEDLNVKGLAGGMLARSVSDAGWGQFATILSAKAEDAGRSLVGAGARLPGAELHRNLARPLPRAPRRDHVAPRARGRR